jgi:hypothetical protein
MPTRGATRTVTLGVAETPVRARYVVWICGFTVADHVPPAIVRIVWTGTAVTSSTSRARMITVSPAARDDTVPDRRTVWQQIVVERLTVNVVVTGGTSSVTSATTPVRSEVVMSLPNEFDAVTRTRRVLPTSAVRTPYDSLVAPVTATHSAPAASQRSHWYVNRVGTPPVYLPGSAASASPTAAVPRTCGGVVFCGAAAALTTALGFELTGPAVPAALRAVTRTISVRPSSAASAV